MDRDGKIGRTNVKDGAPVHTDAWTIRDDGEPAPKTSARLDEKVHFVCIPTERLKGSFLESWVDFDTNLLIGLPIY